LTRGGSKIGKKWKKSGTKKPFNEKTEIRSGGKEREGGRQSSIGRYIIRKDKLGLRMRH